MARKRFPGGGATRHGSWSSLAPQTSLSALAGSSALLHSTFVPFDGGETLIRTRGLFGWKVDQTSADEDQMGAVGIGVVSAQAASQGFASVPHPDTDAGWNGWLWHSYFASSLEFESASGVRFGALHLITIDSKAMRKVGDDYRVVMVVQNSAATGIEIYGNVRLYSKPF